MNRAAMPSRLLRQLEADMEAAQQGGQQLALRCTRARRAGVLARMGRTAEARDELTALHQTAFSSPHAELSAWLCWAESQVAYYSEYDTGAATWLEQALHQGRAAGCRAVEAESLAFMAHLAFAEHRPEVAGDCIAQCFALGPDVPATALARLHLVGGQALHLAQGQDAAQPWYQQARALASACGDDALLSALLYNSAALRVACLREAELAHGSCEGAASMLAVDSVAHFDRAMGVAALEALTPLARAQVLISAGHYAEAMVLMPHNLGDAQRLSLGRLSPALRADWAWCAINLGDPDLARAQAEQALVELGPHCHADDRGCTHARLAQVFGRLDEVARAQAQARLADAAWAEWRALQARWTAALPALPARG